MNERLGLRPARPAKSMSWGENIFAEEVELARLRREVGMVFQRPNPLPLSIRDNVLFSHRIHRAADEKISRADEDALLEDALRQVLLWDHVKDRLNSRATQLSLEEQQKLCIARLLPVKPSGPFSWTSLPPALDPKATEALEALIWGAPGHVHPFSS